ncbi:THAP domain-containing protein 1-like [Dendronephthya gigantea]|uniref:THAP domain-containing protein 1-like n=1 Tax=Dendronephthya gigantea TaxID=151771 RepID=UPI001069DE35|nr:THAP domain-containing protein 1-like [Dendronephthya gigantea]
MPYCMVPGSTNCSKKTKGSEVSYHRLPNELRKIWLRRIRRDNLPKANSCYVCSAHFAPECFESSLKELFGMKTKKALKAGSVPSIFPFVHRKPGRESSQKREINREKIRRVEEVATLLNTEENDEFTDTSTEHDTGGFSTRDAETYCDHIILLDAETQCEKPLQRSIQVQTLAIRKKKSTPMTPAQAKNNSGIVTPPTTPITILEATASTESEQDAEYSSSSTDEFSDSDDDYVCPKLNTSDDSEAEDQKNERKFIVFESMLDQLFISCRTCGSLCEIEKSNKGAW